MRLSCELDISLIYDLHRVNWKSATRKAPHYLHLVKMTLSCKCGHFSWW